ncbi:hypothetical protein BDD12DRAFT_837617 [Trichophaea hybrida]|nr:hypothetical protein BDD12DRAFT_837617 [Trichophaea hybrida]
MPRIVDEDGTPCPVRSSHSGSLEPFPVHPPTAFSLAATYGNDDDTANIDVTMALPDDEPFLARHTRKKKEPKGLKQPPRRITNYVPPVRHERQERNEQQQNAKETKKYVEYIRVASLHAGPERRPQGLQQQPQRSLIGIGARGPSRRRVSAMLQAKHQTKHHEQMTAQDENRARGSAPELRPVGTNQEAIASKRPVLGEKCRNASAQKPSLGEKKHLQAPPKRLPSIIQQPWATASAMRDQSSENGSLPSGEQGVRKRIPEKSPPRKSVRLSNDPIRVPTQKPIPPVSKASAIPSHANKPYERARKRNSDDISYDDEDSFTSQSSHRSNASGSLRLKKRIKTSIGSLPTPPGLTQKEENELLPPSEYLIPGVTSFHSRPNNKKRPLDPVLSDDIERCEMYEESWLSAQESSVSQLLNHLLAEYSPIPVGKHRIPLRKEILAMYSAAPFPLIYNRVHASLLYGALSITQHLLDKSSVARVSRVVSNSSAQHYGWSTDIGVRGKFLDLFLGSYEQSILITGLEVVVGREMFAFAQPEDSEKKILEEYMERYIIKSEDILSSVQNPVQNNKRGSKMGGHSGEDEDRGTPAWLLRRSLLRSFMLIILLDKAKSRGVLGRQCLFKKESHHKSSVSVLKALSRLLLPSIGDISKPLSYLNYTLETEQGPLSEFDYTIKNLAIDLRDGVRLARVVEVLLHSKRGESSSAQRDANEEDWPLSLHLQHPAPSRAQKLHNVSLVLSSLNKAGGNPQNVEAKDIIDGHREKTVGLLWSLLSQWGLELLLDWDAVKKETHRLGWKQFPGVVYECMDLCSGKRDHVELLRNWASNIAIKYGLPVSNLTTSFADGKVFAAIVSEYEQYLPSYSKTNKASLEAKLRGIGCNSYFAGLFDPQTASSRVFNQDFVIAGLAYLCSRLVQPSILERAAMTIQRAYQNLVFRTNVHKRINLLVLAHKCADAVNRKNAAITIQRAYREFLHVKIQKFVASITNVQTLGRAYLVRRSLQQSLLVVIMVQRRWRAIRETRYLKRISVAKQAVIGIQAFVRGILVRQNLLNLKQSICMLETRWSAINLGRQAREEFIHRRMAAVIIQRAFQRHSGSKNERQVFCQTRQFIASIQALARGHLARLQCSQCIIDIMAVQYWYRRARDARKLRVEYTALRQATLFIQQRRRETVLARSLRRDYLRLSAYTSKIKLRYLRKKKEMNAVILLQRAWRTRAWIVRMRRLRTEAVLIQSAWRGYLARNESGPRLRIIRRRIRNTVEHGINEGETLGARTKQALGMVKAKAGFSRGIAQLEEKTALSRECAIIVAEDEAAIIAILTYMEVTVAQVQKSSSSVIARSLLSAINTLATIAGLPVLRSVVGRQVPKGGKDVFNVLLQVIDALKTASTNTPPYELLLLSMSTLASFAETDAIRRRLCARKKWVERLFATLQAIQNAGKRRGATVDRTKSDILTVLFGIFGDGQKV